MSALALPSMRVMAVDRSDGDVSIVDLRADGDPDVEISMQLPTRAGGIIDTNQRVAIVFHRGDSAKHADIAMSYKVLQFDERENNTCVLHLSASGLLMKLSGPQRTLRPLTATSSLRYDVHLRTLPAR